MVVLNRKLNIYRKYHDEQGITLDNKEKQKVFSAQYGEEQVETLISLKLF